MSRVDDLIQNYEKFTRHDHATLRAINGFGAPFDERGARSPADCAEVEREFVFAPSPLKKGRDEGGVVVMPEHRDERNARSAKWPRRELPKHLEVRMAAAQQHQSVFPVALVF